MNDLSSEELLIIAAALVLYHNDDETWQDRKPKIYELLQKIDRKILGALSGIKNIANTEIRGPYS